MEERNNPVVFCEWLKRRRKALDMTQDELAKRAGCSVGALRKIESGDRRPSKQLAGLLAEALDISNDDRQTFIRAARGDLNIERLQPSLLQSRASSADISVLRQAQPGAATSAPLTARAPSHRIPFQATSLIGREVELAAMGRIFNDPQCRLLTLTGVGGIGKTRLAIEFASRNLPSFPGGVFYVPLSPVNSPDKILPAIADVLGFAFSGPAEAKEQLLDYISKTIPYAALLIFDNLEHLLVPVSTSEHKLGVVDLIAEMLQRLPNVKILGTSRERINIHGEWMYELHGLSVPPTDFPGSLEEYSSVALFVNRAQQIKADFEIMPGEQNSIVQICQLVEGVPLAIELAAAWVSVLSCQEIAQEIQSNMDFLTTSMHDIPERHRSIRATFDHSWKLLSENERRALCQCSVFHGGFDRKAAGQIAGASLPLLASLMAKSLLRRTESGRYDLHEVIRQYAWSHLNDHPTDLETCARHCDYYLALARDHEVSLKSASQQAAIRQLTDEIDNLRAAWTWAVQHQKYAQLGQAGRAFGWYFEITGLYREGIEQLELLVQALKARPQEGQSLRILGQTLLHQALLFFRQGEFDRARRLYVESIEILRPTGDQALLADALIFLGTLSHLAGEYERARSFTQEGLAFARAGNAPWFVAYAIDNLGYIDSLMGHPAQGYEQMMAGLAIWRTLGDPHSIALGMNFLVPTLIKLGRFQEAKAFMQESIALCEQSKNRWGMGTAYRFLGLVCLAEGQFTEAKIHLQKSLEVFGESFVGWDIARSLSYLGDATRMSGDSDAARKHYRDALRISTEAKALPIALDALSGVGCLQAQAGDAENALVLCILILSHPSSEEDTKIRVEQLRKTLESRLSHRQIDGAGVVAREKPWERIVKDALEWA